MAENKSGSLHNLGENEIFWDNFHVLRNRSFLEHRETTDAITWFSFNSIGDILNFIRQNEKIELRQQKPDVHEKKAKLKKKMQKRQGVKM